MVTVRQIAPTIFELEGANFKVSGDDYRRAIAKAQTFPNINPKSVKAIVDRRVREIRHKAIAKLPVIEDAYQLDRMVTIYDPEAWRYWDNPIIRFHDLAAAETFARWHVKTDEKEPDQ